MDDQNMNPAGGAAPEGAAPEGAAPAEEKKEGEGGVSA